MSWTCFPHAQTKAMRHCKHYLFVKMNKNKTEILRLTMCRAYLITIKYYKFEGAHSVVTFVVTVLN